ncbi:type IV pilus biogenesis/stability protein PilW [Paucibacter sp. APW11]|uniref:Type IV pilus biogenesis/stability protein PilW n=1 Tax=Roseateles aquae TaxID=3077235 RepID=A0ABU3P7G1_9BURK|nr:type IV pilus biogenesis/stability protein PilW [Paucibacter sp. APW11]MDT8998521.1 type IV pilus biogenesis/stability protein PilW [Paucibacter sp. APW11]
MNDAKQVLKSLSLARLGAAAGLLLLAMLGAGCASGPSSSASNSPRTESDQTDADRRASVRLELAAGYFSRGQYSTALDEIKQALIAKPDLREAINLRSLVYAAMGENEMAEEGFKRALSLNGHDGDTAHNYGWFLCQQSRYAQARTQFDIALAQPQYRSPGRTYLAKGVCDARAGDLEQAERNLTRAFELDPANPSISLNLGEVLLRQGQLERARFYARRVNAQAEQSNAQSLWLELRVERRLGNTVSVEELSQQLRKRHPQSPETQALNNGRFDG